MNRLPEDAVLTFLAKEGIPITRDNYLAFAFLGAKTYDELEGEDRVEVDDLFAEDGTLLQ